MTRAALAMCVVFLSGCGHSGGDALPVYGGTGPIQITIGAGGSTISLQVGATANVTVSEGSYDGPFYGTSLNPNVVTVTPAQAATTTQARRRPLETGVAVFQVTAVATGTTTIVFVDQGGHGAAATVNVVGPSPGVTPTPSASPTSTPGIAQVVLSQSNLALPAVGALYAQSVTASQANYTGAFVASGTSCNGIVTLTQTNSTTFLVTPVSAGICSYTITGGNGASATLGITVTVTDVGGT